MPSTLSPVSLLGHQCEFLRASFGIERFDRHFHDVFSIGLVTSGVNAFTYRGRMVEARAGSVCIADPGETHDGGMSGRAWSYANLFLPVELVEELRAEEGTATAPATMKSSIDDPCVTNAAQSLFSILTAPKQESGSSDGLTNEAALRLVESMFDTNGVRARPHIHPDDAVARRAIEMIADKGGLDVSLEALAHETGVARYRVVRSVRRALGITPMAYALHLRIAKAKAMILAGEPIAQAAAETGFSDQAHLTRRMKRVLGVTPGRLRAA